MACSVRHLCTEFPDGEFQREQSHKGNTITLALGHRCDRLGEAATNTFHPALLHELRLFCLCEPFLMQRIIRISGQKAGLGCFGAAAAVLCPLRASCEST